VGDFERPALVDARIGVRDRDVFNAGQRPQVVGDAVGGVGRQVAGHGRHPARR